MPIAITSVVVALMLSACSSRQFEPDHLESLEYTSSPAVHHDPLGQATVALAWARAEKGWLIIRAVFTPDDPGFHLYSATLPKTGIDGIGRPTLIEVAELSRYAEIGSIVADKVPKELRFELLNASFPVYPDGPVTLYLPLRPLADWNPHVPIGLKLTYMTCNDELCRAPVEGAFVALTIDQGADLEAIINRFARYVDSGDVDSLKQVAESFASSDGRWCMALLA